MEDLDWAEESGSDDREPFPVYSEGDPCPHCAEPLAWRAGSGSISPSPPYLSELDQIRAQSPDQSPAC